MYKLTQELVERFLHTHKHGVEGDFGYDPSSSLTVGHTVCHNDMMSTLFTHTYHLRKTDREKERTEIRHPCENKLLFGNPENEIGLSF